ncbi:MAG: hypothetical protein ACFB2W_09430 [Leptolyngbyaceae cyanobacterium]
MSTTVLPQLVEAESLLSEQEAALMQQLTEIQDKRKGLQTVIAMFDGSTNSNGRSAAAAPVVTEAEDAEPAEDTVAAQLARVTKAKTIKKSAAKAEKKDGRTARWQRYVLDEHSQQRLQDVVANVLKAKSNDTFKITDVMSAIFEDDMPKTQFLKARSRISNILSAGARDSDWYRGRGGTYSMSKKAVSSR